MMCNESLHFYTTASDSTDGVIPAGTKCDCGMVTWIYGHDVMPEVMRALETQPFRPLFKDQEDDLEDMWGRS